MKSIYHSKFKLALAITTGGWQLLLVMYLMYIHCKSGFDTKILTRASEGGAMYFLIGEHMQRLKKKGLTKKAVYLFSSFYSETCEQYPDFFTHCPYYYLGVIGP